MQIVKMGASDAAQLPGLQMLLAPADLLLALTGVGCN